jgi:hypothetical protein
MATPNSQNTAQAPSHEEIDRMADEADAALDAIEKGEVKEGGIKEGDIIEMTSIAKSPEEYAKMKGIPVRFPYPNKDPNEPDQIVEGRLVEWDDNANFRVVGFVDGALRTKVFDAGKLITMPENDKLRGAVEFLREHEKEQKMGGTEVRSMLSSVLESSEGRAA